MNGERNSGIFTPNRSFLDTPYFIAKRIAFSQSRTFSRFIIRLAITATVISVAAMILSLAFINGFQKVISEKIFNFWGHLRIQHFEPFRVSIAEETPITSNDTVVRSIRAMPVVTHVQPFATKSAILNAHSTIEGVLFKGVSNTYDFKMLAPFLQSGRWVQFPDSGYSTDIVIPESMAKQLEVTIGESVLIYFIQPGEERPRTRKVQVAGIFKTGIDIYDRIYALGDIRLIRQLNDWDSAQIGGYEVMLRDYREMNKVSDSIYEKLPMGWNSSTMKEIYPDIFDWLKLQDTNRVILLTVMAAVAIINLVTCLIILVLERTRMIGVLKAVGGSDWDVQKIFMYYGAYISLAGVLGGVLLGLALAWLQLKTGFIRLNEESYYMTVAPVEIIWWQVGLVAIGTFLLCTLVLLIPSLISRKTSPAQVVQFR